jgi:hypothetical protein
MLGEPIRWRYEDDDIAISWFSCLDAGPIRESHIKVVVACHLGARVHWGGIEQGPPLAKELPWHALAGFSLHSHSGEITCTEVYAS